MKSRLGFLSLVVLSALSLCSGKMTIGDRARKMRARSPVVKRHVLPRNTAWRYENKNSEQYKVTGLPGIDFDFGELYSGNIPVGNDSSRTLFFVFNPKIGGPSEDLTIWLNGKRGEKCYGRRN
jgi:carboxypeptidase D